MKQPQVLPLRWALLMHCVNFVEDKNKHCCTSLEFEWTFECTSSFPITWTLFSEFFSAFKGSVGFSTYDHPYEQTRSSFVITLYPATSELYKCINLHYRYMHEEYFKDEHDSINPKFMRILTPEGYIEKIFLSPYRSVRYSIKEVPGSTPWIGTTKGQYYWPKRGSCGFHQLIFEAAPALKKQVEVFVGKFYLSAFF